MKEDFIKLTNSVYRILEFLPETDPLKNRAKDKALAIMDNLVSISDTTGWASFQNEKVKANIAEDVDMLLGYLWIAKTQGWLNSANYLIVSNEYEKIKKEIKPAIELAPIVVVPQEEPKVAPDPVLTKTEPKTPSFNISGRQGKILEFLQKHEKGQVMDFQTVLPDITKRTIRRDLDELLLAGKVTRMGEFNQVFYKIKG